MINNFTSLHSLSYLISLGARTRNSNYIASLKIFLFPTLLIISLQSIIYIFFMLNAYRNDYFNILITLTILTLIPILSSLVLCAFRPTGAPVLNSVAVSTILFSFAVSILSAFRVPISYQAMLASYPVIIFIMAYSNVQFSSIRLCNVAMLKSQKITKKLEGLGVPIISELSDLSNTNVEVLLIDPAEHHQLSWSEILTESHLRGIHVVSWTWYAERRFGCMDIESFSLAHLVYSPSQFLYARLKRFLDIIIAILSLPIVLPFLLLISIYIYCVDRGPILFMQTRYGYGGKKFQIMKLRTMYKGTSGGVTQTNDTRILPGCNLIRRLRIDELPQIYNIFRGEMSWIGPRPVADYVAESSTKIEPKYELRMLVLPGITGWAQVEYSYAGNTREEIAKLSYDLYYLKNLSFDLDLLIIFKTVSKVITGIGAR